MQPGKILVADHKGVYVIKMTGDVRLTLCISFDQFIDTMFAEKHFSTVLFDLSEVEAIDSTTLGLMAKISLQGDEEHGIKPLVLSTNPSINRLLRSMGFEEIFTIVDDLDTPVQPLKPLEENTDQENDVRDKVIEAHKVLMSLNDENKKTFRNLVQMLENN
ncbi:STAS domain-containing protein [Marinimicrobium alkaliphilum]|uniref:STAS domain-containing protein n=1 Tax=Marinimicrobium alkaliphilum TaxID=2202654 RepID=UPI000DBA546D|nr:STAS domain-containing protein [Marinimicrobium alkaliphilum]